jgi:hypothetical protein
MRDSIVFRSAGVGVRFRINNGLVKINTLKPSISISYRKGIPIPCISNWARERGVQSHIDVPLIDLPESFVPKEWNKNSDKSLLIYLEGDRDCDQIRKWVEIFEGDIHCFTDRLRVLPLKVIQHPINSLNYKYYLSRKKDELMMYDRIDTCKLLMMQFSFQQGYEFCAIFDCFKNHAIKIPTLYWDVAKLAGIIYGARLENWAYIAHKSASDAVDNMMNHMEKETFHDESIYEFIYENGPFIMSNYYFSNNNSIDAFERFIDEKKINKLNDEK